MGCLLSLSNPLRQFFFPLVFFVFFSPVNGKDNLTPPSFTPINGDLYHSRYSIFVFILFFFGFLVAELRVSCEFDGFLE